MTGIMKSTTEYLTFHLPMRMDFVNITPQVEEIVRKSGVREGLLPDMFEIRHNQGGIAVSGEITLHTDTFMCSFLNRPSASSRSRTSTRPW